MEEETLSIIAIIISAIAIIGLCGVYFSMPQEPTNLVTWSAVSDVDDRVDALQLRVLELERENKPINYDSILDNIRDDIDDLDDDIDDINDGEVERCFQRNDNLIDFTDCIENEF